MGMDTNENDEGQRLDPYLLIEVQKEQVAQLAHENAMMGALVRQYEREILSLQEIMRQKDDDAVPGEG